MKKLIIYEGVVNVINDFLSPEETKEFISLLTDWVFNDVEPFGKASTQMVDCMLNFMKEQVENEKKGISWEEYINREVDYWIQEGAFDNYNEIIS